MKTLLLPSSPSSFCCSFFFAYCRITCMQKVVYIISVGFPGGASGKNLTCQCWRCKRCGFNPWVRKILWRRAWQPTPVFLLGESHGQRSLVGYGPWGHKELDTTERLSTYIKQVNKYLFILFMGFKVSDMTDQLSVYAHIQKDIFKD